MVVQLCPTLCNTMDCSPPGSSLMGFPRQEYWSGLPFPSPGDLPDPGIEPCLLLSSEPPGKPEANSRSLLINVLNSPLGNEMMWLRPRCGKFPLTQHVQWRHLWTRLVISVQFRCSVESDSLQPHGLQHTRLSCPSPTPRAYSMPKPLLWNPSWKKSCIRMLVRVLGQVRCEKRSQIIGQR